MRRIFFLVVATVALLALPGVASAASYSVNDTGDFALASPSGKSCVSTNGGTCTLRAAVQAADNSGGASSISLPAGTYTLTIASAGADDPSTGDLDVNSNGNGTAITVAGAGSGSTVIDAHGIDRAFAVQSDGGLSLTGLTIENGSPSSSSSGLRNGGAIWVDSGPGSSLSVSGATLQGNSASEGGGIYDDSPNTMSIDSSAFSDNVASIIGGALQGENGGMTIASSTFTDNTGGDGGAIDWLTPSGTQESVTNSSFDGNSSPNGAGGAISDFGGADSVTFDHDLFRDSSALLGGALYIETGVGAQYMFDHDQFDANHATGGPIPGEGGAINIDVGVNDFNGSSFVGNTADQGGAIYIQAIDALSLVNTTMSDNSATTGGAIDDPYPAPATLTNDTIAFNTAAAGQVGGIDGTSSLQTGSGGAGVQNTIIAENGGGDCDATFASGFDHGHNLDSDSSCFGGLGAPGDKPGVNPLLGGPAGNGGPVVGAPGTTETLETDAELSGSPAIDAASNAGCPATDERGVPRPQGPACDMGAYEATPPIATTDSATGITPSSATLNGTVNPANLPTTYHFEYGTSTAYGSSTASQSAGADYADHPESAAIGGLTPGTTYHFRIVATNSVGTSDGADHTFTATTTPASAKAPVVVTGPPTGVGSRSATVTGSVNAEGVATSYHFEFGTSTHYGRSTTAQSVGSGTTAVQVMAHLTGLRPGAIYHYRLVATSAGGTTTGSDRTMHTHAIIAVAGVLSGACTRASSTVLHVRITSLLRPSTTVRLDGRRLARGRHRSVRIRVTLADLRAGPHSITVTTSSRAGTTRQRLHFSICTASPAFTG